MRSKFDWLQSIAADDRMRGLPTSIAILIAHRYLNSKTEVAWPSIERLAGDVRAQRRNVQLAADKLVLAGYLVRERGGGSGKPNTYRLADPHKQAEKTASPTATKKGVAERQKTASPTTPEPEKEPERNQREHTTARKHSPRRRSDAQEIPWPEVLTIAQENAPAWKEGKVEDEFRKCEHHYEGKRVNLGAKWKAWCIRGTQYDAEQAARRNRTIQHDGLREAALGLKDFLGNKE